MCVLFSCTNGKNGSMANGDSVLLIAHITMIMCLHQWRFLSDSLSDKMIPICLELMRERTRNHFLFEARDRLKPDCKTACHLMFWYFEVAAFVRPSLSYIAHPPFHLFGRSTVAWLLCFHFSSSFVFNEFHRDAA